MSSAYGLAVSGRWSTTVLVLFVRPASRRHPVVLVAVLLPILALEIVFSPRTRSSLEGGWFAALAMVIVAITTGTAASRRSRPARRPPDDGRGLPRRCSDARW
jgi:K+ transporter